MQYTSLDKFECLKLVNQEFRACKQNPSSIQPIPCDAMRFLVYTHCLKEHNTNKKRPHTIENGVYRTHSSRDRDIDIFSLV